MQTRSRCCHSPFPIGIDRLIVPKVTLIRRPLAGDVRRQRHLAVTGDGCIQNRPGNFKTQGDFTAITTGFNLRIKPAGQTNISIAAEFDPVTFLHSLGRFAKRQPAGLIETLMQRNLDTCTCCPIPMANSLQPCRNNPGIVEHQAIARRKVFHQVLNVIVRQGTCLVGINNEKPRGIARLHGP